MAAEVEYAVQVLYQSTQQPMSGVEVHAIRYSDRHVVDVVTTNELGIAVFSLTALCTFEAQTSTPVMIQEQRTDAISVGDAHKHSHDADLLEVSPDDHHDQAHSLSGGDHIGQFSAAQHPVIASGNHHPEYELSSFLLGQLVVMDFGSNPSGQSA